MLPGIAGIAGFVASDTEAPGTGNITIPAGAVSSDVTGFPVYIDLSDMDAEFWSLVDADGGNIRVKQSGSVIPFDLVTIDTGTETGRLFFKADLSSASDNHFTIDLSGSALLDPTDTNGRNNVWTRFNRVFDGAGNVDRTGSGNTLTLVGNTAFTGGQIVFDGVDDFSYVSCTAPTDLTIFIVGHLDGDIPAGQHHVVASYATAATGTPGDRHSLIVRDTGNWATWYPSVWLESATAASFNADFTAAFYRDHGVKRAVWVNGTEVVTSATTGTISATTPHFTLGGEDDTPATEFQGKMDLACYAIEALPSAYLAALHTNRRDRASFYTVA